MQNLPDTTQDCGSLRLAPDSPLEGTGFEPSVPPDRSSRGTYPADVRSDAPTLFSSGARRRLRATRIRSASIAGSGYIVRELSLFPSRSPKETRIHKWDQEFESGLLQRRVSCEPEAGTVTVGIFALGPTGLTGSQERAEYPATPGLTRRVVADASGSIRAIENTQSYGI